MRPLVAVISCHHESRFPFLEYWNERAKELAYLGIDCRVFFGRGDSLGWDLMNRWRVGYPIDDCYKNMPQKTYHACMYALLYGYDSCLRVCDDTEIHPAHFAQTIKEWNPVFDYIGNFLNRPSLKRNQGFMHGGAGFFLSTKALYMIARNPWRQENLHPADSNNFADDYYIGAVLQKTYPFLINRDSYLKRERRLSGLNNYQLNSILVKNDHRFYLNCRPPDWITAHWSENSGVWAR